mmetsp:Transcript_36209/g.91401  ORF Transcript_36209/g.91401 Transcript_36209/m.91401 type:complete len:496 (+) Transcript_36209:81-1568(+)
MRLLLLLLLLMLPAQHGGRLRRRSQAAQHVLRPPAVPGRPKLRGEQRVRVGVADDAATLARVVDERRPLGARAQRGGVAQDPHRKHGARDGHVHAADVAHESHAALFRARAHARQDHHVQLLPLEAINRLDEHLVCQLLPAHLLERAPEALALVAVWGDDANRHSRRVRRLLHLVQQLHIQRCGHSRLRLVAHAAAAGARFPPLVDVEEDVGLEHAVAVERRVRARYHALAILQLVLVEVAGRKLPDDGVHAVLNHQHVHRAAALLQALEQRPLHQARLGLHAEHRGGQLLRVPHQHTLLAAIHQGLQSRHLASLAGLVNEDGVDAHVLAILHARKDVAPAGGERGEDDLRMLHQLQLQVHHVPPLIGLHVLGHKVQPRDLLPALVPGVVDLRQLCGQPIRIRLRLAGEVTLLPEMLQVDVHVPAILLELDLHVVDACGGEILVDKCLEPHVASAWAQRGPAAANSHHSRTVDGAIGGTEAVVHYALQQLVRGSV